MDGNRLLELSRLHAMGELSDEEYLNLVDPDSVDTTIYNAVDSSNDYTLADIATEGMLSEEDSSANANETILEEAPDELKAETPADLHMESEVVDAVDALEAKEYSGKKYVSKYTDMADKAAHVQQNPTGQQEMSAIDDNIEAISKAILDDVMASHIASNTYDHTQPDRDAIIRIIDNLEVVLFPSHFANQRKAGGFALKYEMGSRLSDIYTSLSEQITLALLQHQDYKNSPESVRKNRAGEITNIFFSKITKIRAYLKTDIEAAFDGDPAAVSFDEIIFCYPGFFAIMVNRIAHELYELKVPMVPRIMTEYAHTRTGVDIHPGAVLGKYFFIDHGTGVVVGETTVIGEHVKLYQGVTLGGLSTREGQGLKGRKRHPTIGDHVTIYSNASVLGGETYIGDHCIVGGNCFVTKSIAPGMRVSNSKNELQIIPDKRKTDFDD